MNSLSMTDAQWILICVLCFTRAQSSATSQSEVRKRRNVANQVNHFLPEQFFLLLFFVEVYSVRIRS